jgi:hypothetical protein
MFSKIDSSLNTTPGGATHPLNGLCSSMHDTATMFVVEDSRSSDGYVI